MLLKIIVPLLIFLSFLMISTSPKSLNICIPDGCSFVGNSCSDNDCLNETIAQHLGERTALFNTTVNLNRLILFFGVLLLAVVISDKDIQFLLDRLYYKYKLFEWRRTRLFYYLTGLFARGILNPKIY